MKPNTVIALDVGGTYIKSSLVVDGIPVTESGKQFPALSDQDADTILNQFIAIFQYQFEYYTQVLGKSADCHWHIGLAFPGPFDYPAGICYIQGLSKFEALYGLNVREQFYQRLEAVQHEAWATQLRQADIRFENDAKLFALGISALFPEERFISLTLGTGLGSAFIDNSTILSEGTGVPTDGWLYDKPYQDGIIEDAISRRGILRAAEQSGALQPGMDVKELAESARNGCAQSLEVFHRFGSQLAEILEPYVASFAPLRIVFGGQIAKSIDLFGPSFERDLSNYTFDMYTSDHVLENTFIGISRLFI